MIFQILSATESSDSEVLGLQVIKYKERLKRNLVGIK